MAAGPLAVAQSDNAEPKVWLDMTQQELNDAYSQFIYAPNIRQVVARYGEDNAYWDGADARGFAKLWALQPAIAAWRDAGGEE